MPNWKKIIVSGSDASLNSLNVSNNVGITGSLTVLNNALLGDSAAGYVIDTNTGTWLGGTPTTGLDVASGVLYDLNGNASIEWQNRSLVDVDSNTVLTWVTSSNNGVRLYGTASYALTASHLIGGASTINIQDEGSGIGSAGTINFTGAGVTATFGGGTATVNIPGGGSATAGGANTTIQFNDSTVLSGSGNFTFNKSTNRVELTGSLGVSAGITGSLFGTASVSTLTTSASVSSSNSAGSNYLLFAETTVGNSPLRTDGVLSYVPDTNELSTHTVAVSDKLTILKALCASRGLGSSATGTIVVNDASFFILCDTQTGTVDVDLTGAESNANNGRILVIKDAANNAAGQNITFTTGASIENGVGYTIVNSGESIVIVFDAGSGTWWVIAKFTP